MRASRCTCACINVKIHDCTNHGRRSTLRKCLCVCVCVCVCVVRLVGTLMPDCVGSVANGLGYMKV